MTFTSASGGITRTLEVTQFSGSTLNLDISTTEQVVISTADTYSIDVDANTEWTWISDASWLTADGEDIVQTNVGPSAFTFEVRDNNSDQARSATITFFTTSGGISRTLTVNQLGGTGFLLSLSDTQQANSSAAQTRTLAVFSNTDWTWVSDSEWLTAGIESVDQNGDQTFTYEVAENQTSDTRTGTLTFATATGGITATLEVTQLGGSIDEFLITLSDAQQASSFLAQEREVIVTTDLTQGWVWDSDADWLTSDELDTQFGTQIFKYNVTANSTGSARTGTIIFRTISGGLSVSLEVTQFGDAAFSLTLSTDTSGGKLRGARKCGGRYLQYSLELGNGRGLD